MLYATGEEYLTSAQHTWCPGCGIGTMLGALARSLEELEYKRNEVVVVTGIGCTGQADTYMKTNALHGTHGRALAFATGMKAFNPDLKVIAIMGDGDGVTIGGNHFIHAARRNIDVTAIVINNFNFGMTGGQASGTTPWGKFTSTTLFGNPERHFDVSSLACSAGANYVARVTPAHAYNLMKYIKEALTHKGFSLVEVISPCPTNYGKRNEMKGALDMFRWLKEKSISINKYKELDDEQQEEYFSIGKLCEHDYVDFNTTYKEVQAAARVAKKGP